MVAGAVSGWHPQIMFFKDRKQRIRRAGSGFPAKVADATRQLTRESSVEITNKDNWCTLGTPTKTHFEVPPPSFPVRVCSGGGMQNNYNKTNTPADKIGKQCTWAPVQNPDVFSSKVQRMPVLPSKWHSFG